MAVPQHNLRGVQDIRTHSGRVSEATVPHKAYMRLACLELEKFRRGREMASALSRTASIEGRFREFPG